MRLQITMTIFLIISSFCVMGGLGDDLLAFWNFDVDMNESISKTAPSVNVNANVFDDARCKAGNCHISDGNNASIASGFEARANFTEWNQGNSVADLLRNPYQEYSVCFYENITKNAYVTLQFLYNTGDDWDAGERHFSVIAINLNSTSYYIRTGLGCSEEGVSNCIKQYENTSYSLNYGDGYFICSVNKFDGSGSAYSEMWVNENIINNQTQTGLLDSLPDGTTFEVPMTITGYRNTWQTNETGYNIQGVIDMLGVWNRTLSYSDISALYNEGNGIQYPQLLLEGVPVISNANCTSCNIPYGDNETPFTTYDTTPTFRFDTDVDANCRIGDENLNYTAMGEYRNCSGGQGEKDHVCSLSIEDELFTSDGVVFVSCESASGGNMTAGASVSLQMDILNLEANFSKAIDRGIENSLIWPGVVIYDDQRIFIKDIGGNTVDATVDRVAVYGNQRWILNVAVDNESTLGLFNITPVVYVLDMANATLTDIPGMVSGLINSTKN